MSVLINNAAQVSLDSHFERLDDRGIENMVYTNLIAPIKLSRQIYSLFLKRGAGTIININSLVGLDKKKFKTMYSTSKWGLRGFANSLRLEAEENNIGIMNVYLSKVKSNPEDKYGMDIREVAEKIYENYKSSNFREIILDGRPEKYKSKSEEKITYIKMDSE